MYRFWEVSCGYMSILNVLMMFWQFSVLFCWTIYGWYATHDILHLSLSLGYIMSCSICCKIQVLIGHFHHQNSFGKLHLLPYFVGSTDCLLIDSLVDNLFSLFVLILWFQLSALIAFPIFQNVISSLKCSLIMRVYLEYRVHCLICSMIWRPNLALWRQCILYYILKLWWISIVVVVSGLYSLIMFGLLGYKI